MSKARPTKTVVVLAYANAQVLDIVGPMQLLGSVNTGRTVPAYDLILLAERAGPFRTSGGVQLVADGEYAMLPRSIDTLIVSGGRIDEATQDLRLAAAVRAGAARARRIASICSGAFFSPRPAFSRDGA